MLSKIDRFITKCHALLAKVRDKFLTKYFKALARMGVIADVVSLIGLASGMVAAIYLHYSHALFIFFWAGKKGADIIDGPISKLNNKKLFRNIDMDRFCDNLFAVILILSTIPYIGWVLPIFAVVVHLILLRFFIQWIGRSSFVPTNWAQYFFLFRLFKAGVIAQIVLTVVSLIYRSFIAKKKLRANNCYVYSSIKTK